MTGVALTTPTVAITPLPFWFSRGDPGVYLPIDALTADPVRLTVSFSPITSLYVSSAKSTTPVANMVAAGDAYFPLAGSPFYAADPAGQPIPGLGGNPAVSVNAAKLPGLQLPTAFTPGDTYVMAEYIYLDAPESNRFRISDIEVPVTQHYTFDPFDTKTASRAYIPLKIPNPTRNLFFYAQRYEAPFYNAPFLATRDLSGADAPTSVPWWPNAAPISARSPSLIRPAFVFRDSEPLQAILLEYEGKYSRYTTTSPSVFRSLMPSYEMKKSPFVNRYYYTLHFGLNHGQLPHSQPCGEANLDKLVNINFQLEFKPFRGSTNPNQIPRYIVYCWAETYNIFRVYAGRGGLLFSY